MGPRLQRAVKVLRRHGRFWMWFTLAGLNGVAFAVCLRVGVMNWIALGFFVFSFAHAVHYASART